MILWSWLLCPAALSRQAFACSRSGGSQLRGINAADSSASVRTGVLLPAFYIAASPQPSAAGLLLEVWVSGRRICPPQLLLALLHAELLGQGWPLQSLVRCLSVVCRSPSQVPVDVE